MLEEQGRKGRVLVAADDFSLELSLLLRLVLALAVHDFAAAAAAGVLVAAVVRIIDGVEG